uniref:CRAL-TRIO domain-containing protein n=1 Tax=Craspedostauros australis TaxID=1486917 RepID=A0A7R9WNG5_9STRA
MRSILPLASLPLLVVLCLAIQGKSAVAAPFIRRHANVPRGGSTNDGVVTVTVGSDATQQEDDNDNDNNGDDNNADASKDDPFIFSLFQPGDGSESDRDGIPNRFLRMQKGNRMKALTAMQDTLAWREEFGVDSILSQPHPKFLQCKSILPHAFLGRDPTDHVIFAQRPGMTDLDGAHTNDVSTQDLLRHYVYVLEYCWNVVEPRPDQTMTSILDMQGVQFSLLRQRELVGFIKQFVNMMSKHYPQRSHKTLMLNAPRWFGTLFSLFKPLLRESTKAKIQIFSASQTAQQRDVLVEILGEEGFAAWEQWCRTDSSDETETAAEASADSESSSAPPTSTSYISTMEQALHQFCEDQLAQSQQPMLQVVAQ